MAGHSSDKDEDALAGLEPRRTPVQARSRERVDRILDAAAQLLVEEGYDAVKTNHIAKRAEVSIGSIYQFFPNKYAIFHSLAVRYMDRIADILSEQLGPEAPPRPWEEVIDDVIETLAELWRTEPAFLAVWMAIQNTAELRAADQQYSTIIVNDVLSAFLQRTLPFDDEERRMTMARIMFEVSQRLLDHSMRNGPTEPQDRMVIDELKFLLRSYIRGHIDAVRNAEGTSYAGWET